MPMWQVWQVDPLASAAGSLLASSWRGDAVSLRGVGCSCASPSAGTSMLASVKTEGGSRNSSVLAGCDMAYIVWLNQYKEAKNSPG